MHIDLTTYLLARQTHDYRTMVTIINALEYNDYTDTSQSEALFDAAAQDLSLLVKQPYLITRDAFETNAFPDSFLRHFSTSWVPLCECHFHYTLTYLIEQDEMVLVHAWIAALREELLFDPSWAPIFALGILTAGNNILEYPNHFQSSHIKENQECFIAQYVEPLKGMFDVNILDYPSYDIPPLEELTFNMDAWNQYYTQGTEAYSEVPLCL